MKHRTQNWMSGGAVALAAVASSAFALLAWSPELAPGAGSLGQAVQVRGLWTVEVREPDGSLVEIRRFENAYVDSDHLVDKLLSGDLTKGYWEVVLNGGACTDSVGTQTACILQEHSTNALDNNEVSRRVTVSSALGSLRISGTKEATASGPILNVQTYLGSCASSVAPDDCQDYGFNDGGSPVTTHTLASQVDVQNGQAIIVNFELQFAAAN